MPDAFPILAKDDLLARIDEGWREFRARVRHVGREGMSRRTTAGWTYRDLLAHVAAWEEEAARGLRALREGGEIPRFGTDAAVDAFNARAIEERRLVGAEAIVDELEAAHRTLVALVRDLRPELVPDPRLQRWVAGNTFGHYAEHAAELDAGTVGGARPSR